MQFLKKVGLAGLIRALVIATMPSFATPAHAIEISSLVGDWEGAYSCGQGIARASVNIWSEKRGVFGVFAFRPPPGGGGQSGEYYIDVATTGDEVTFTPTRWKRQPPGYMMVPVRLRLVGQDKLRGRMTVRSCGEINLSRVRVGDSETDAGATNESQKKSVPSQSATQAPPRPGQAGLPWIGRPPTDVIDGRTLFQVLGVSDSLIRDKARLALNDEIRFFPARHQSAVSLGVYGPKNQRRSIDEYLLLFCASAKPTCAEPFKYIEGGVVVRFTTDEPTETFVHFHIASMSPRNRYCKVTGSDLRCRIDLPYGIDKQMYATDGNVYGLIASIRDGYSDARHPADLTNNIATSGSAIGAKDLLRCVDYPSEQSYYVFVDKDGREVSARDYEEPSYFLGNKCAFPIHVVVRVDAEGGCPFRLGEVLPNAVLGGFREYTLKPGQAGYLGRCRGTITVLERK